jgi:23S rRNA (uracil1939-C5)-methyltransferase
MQTMATVQEIALVFSLPPCKTHLPMMDESTQHPESLTIEQVSFGGDGISRHNGKVYFIQDTVPGDVVAIEIEEDKGRYAKGRVGKFITPSPLRAPSPCQYSEVCGGCQWQGISYKHQLEWKTNFVRSNLQRIGRLGEVDVGITPSPIEFAYRNRIHLKGRWSNGDIRLGFFKRRSRDFVHIPECKITDPNINRLMNEIENLTLTTEEERKFRVELQFFAGKKDGSESAGCTAVFYPERPDQTPFLRPLVEEITKLKSVLWAGFMFETDQSPYFTLGEYNGLSYPSAPGLFQQVNQPANDLMRAYVHGLVEQCRPTHILDLYCGSGNLSLELVRKGYYVEGIEYSKPAIKCANHSLAKMNNPKNSIFLAGDAVAHVWKISKKNEPINLVISDPPREGMFEAVNPLLNIAADNIIYISCDPSTLARDLGKLCRSQYEIASVQAFDFFPHTFHIETVVHLRKRTV